MQCLTLVVEKGFQVLTVIIMVLGALSALCEGAAVSKEKIYHVRLKFSSTLGLALTFLIASEIIKTFRIAHWSQLLKIMLLLLIRQLLLWSLDADSEKIEKRLDTNNGAPGCCLRTCD
jgi:uncharacterized membrane protein